MSEQLFLSSINFQKTSKMSRKYQLAIYDAKQKPKRKRNMFNNNNTLFVILI